MNAGGGQALMTGWVGGGAGTPPKGRGGVVQGPPPHLDICDDPVIKPWGRVSIVMRGYF